MEYSKKISLMWRVDADYFEHKNSDVINAQLITRLIGSTASAVNELLRNTEELQMLMPYILGLDHTAYKDQSWSSVVSNYWHSLSVPIYAPGKDLETGFKFDIDSTNPIQKEHIAKLKETSKITTSEELGEYVMGTTKNTINVLPELRYRYGFPINTSDFLLWQFCLNHNHVANDKGDVNKSPKIRFYLLDETVAKKERESLHKLNITAQQKYLEVISKPQDVTNILMLLKKSIDPTTPNDDIKTTREIALAEAVKDNPKAFLDVVNDPKLQSRAKIEKYISLGILKRLENSSIIVDGQNPEIVLGNTNDEVLTWFANDIHKDGIAEYEARAKSVKL